MKAKEKAILQSMLIYEPKSEDENEENSTQFKATPVPDHVRKPLFGQMLQKHPAR